MKNSIPVLLVVLLFAASCKKAAVPSPVAASNQTGTLIADTITYQIPIKNQNPDDKWTEKCLHKLNRKAFIDSIFTLVYKGGINAYNLETNEKMTARQVRDLENTNGYSRDKIDMVQFTEAWYFDSKLGTMNKKVLAMVLGYNVYTPEGDLIGPKPIFRIDMK
jgi:hypothetical protein